jgi:hypothetical protein
MCFVDHSDGHGIIKEKHQKKTGSYTLQYFDVEVS